MDERQKKHLQANLRKHKGLTALMKRLISFGGDFLVAPWNPEKDLKTLLSSRSKIFEAQVKMKYGKASRCHSNVAAMFLRDPKHIRVCTGYALSDDGLWRQHSWAMKGDYIVETTEKRMMYFGFTLNDDEALDFANANY